MKDVILVVLLGLLALVTILWATQDRTPTETVVVVNPADAWWNLPKDRLQRFVRQQMLAADVVKVVVLDNRKVVETKSIRDKEAIQLLADHFTITSEIGPAGTFLGARETHIEISGASTIRLVLGRSWLLYGPWGAGETEGDVEEKLFQPCWHTVEVSPDFYDALQEQFGVSHF
jgi:hypothetical protein